MPTSTRRRPTLAWRNGTWVANGNLVPRHLGIPTVTVPMGTMADIGMPVGLTFAGKAYDDNDLLRYGVGVRAVRRAPNRPAADAGRCPDEVEGVFAGPARGSRRGTLPRSPIGARLRGSRRRRGPARGCRVEV